MNDQFSDPGTSGDHFSTRDHEGALLLVKVTGMEHGIETDYGVKDAVKADVTRLDGDAAQEFPNALLFSAGLVRVLQGQVGNMILGRLVKVTTKKGRTTWDLTAASEADKATARTYIAKNTAPAPF